MAKTVMMIEAYASPDLVLLPDKAYNVPDSFAAELVRSKMAKVLTTEEVIRLRRPPEPRPNQPDPEDKRFVRGGMDPVAPNPVMTESLLGDGGDDDNGEFDETK